MQQRYISPRRNPLRLRPPEDPFLRQYPPGEFFIFFPRDWHVAKVANDGEMLLKVSLKVVFKVSLTPYPPSLPLPLRPYEQ